MKVTVCELNDNSKEFSRDWEALVEHARAQSSQLVLLPEMPFYPWFAINPNFDEQVWQAAIAAHDAWLTRLSELAPAVVISTRPVVRHNRRLNEGFIWEAHSGYRLAHHKVYLPNEEGFWEASWYSRGEGSFTALGCGAARLGFEICTELWSMECGQLYGKAGAHLILTPRATEKATVDKWLVGGRATAVVSGAYSLSSNRTGSAGHTLTFGGQGWVVSPDGDVLGLTSPAQPFLTVEIDLQVAEQAKLTYPRYVFI
jgi:predicted amidohydrolase